MRSAKWVSVLTLFAFIIAGTAWPNTEVTSIIASPKFFNSLNGEITSITVTATAGVDNLEIRVLSPDGSTLIKNGLALSEISPGQYTIQWDGKDNNGLLVASNTYVLRVYNLATTTYIGAWSNVTVQGIFFPPISRPFTPTGNNTALITVQAPSGQSGMYVNIVHNNWRGYDWRSRGNPPLYLIETTTPGIYTVEWTAIERGYYYTDHIWPDGTYNIIVYDSVNNQMPTTGQITISGVASVNVAPDRFNAFGGETTAITVSGAADLNLQAKITKWNSSTGREETVRVLPLSGTDTTYTAMWDGTDESGNLLPLGSYTIEVWHTGSLTRYYPTGYVTITGAISSVSTAPSLFTPTGNNTALITVQAPSGQSGMYVNIVHN
ncbi:MAG TPA: FlgD immunoglobulin-like domain containing protein, partial [Candidatus Limnocylindrales bacterium]|nr:FlgD immunoglobulin-like domain containing protein [Candidatus Limnocylindrales bacterium]